VKYDSWIEELYCKEFLVKQNNVQGNSSGDIKAKREASGITETDKGFTRKLQTQTANNKNG